MSHLRAVQLGAKSELDRVLTPYDKLSAVQKWRLRRAKDDYDRLLLVLRWTQVPEPASILAQMAGLGASGHVRFMDKLRDSGLLRVWTVNGPYGPSDSLWLKGRRVPRYWINANRDHVELTNEEIAAVNLR